MKMRSLVCLSFAFALCAQESGERTYRTQCAPCHGGKAEGGERGPSITSPVSLRSDSDLADLIRNGLPGAGMPGSPNIGPSAMSNLLAYLRTLVPKSLAAPERIEAAGVKGIIRNKSDYDLQLLGDDGKLHLFRRGGSSAWREVRGDRDWSTYHGSYTGNRHSPLQQITRDNVKDLRAAWIYNIPGSGRLEGTPIVIDGVMYMTSVNEVHAIDAGTGRRIWQYKRPRTKGLIGDASGGINRGVAIHGDRLFLVTDHAHLLALHRNTGALLWDVEMADHRENYGATVAPLVVGDLVYAGTSGGDEGVRGFLAAYHVATGKQAWRFWTVPLPGEPGSETWQGTGVLPHGCATTWLTGTYDAQLDLLYWTTGNPCPDYNGDERRGDNLYSNSVLALRPKTGELVWHFQYTPHDVHDWDAQQPPMLVDEPGTGRKLLMQASRNGFFYVLDRTNGAFLKGTPFVKKLNWAKGLDAKGRPILEPTAVPNAEGKTDCPSVEGATNWFSTAFHPGTGLFYVQALEKCTVYTKTPGKWEAGKSYYDGTTHDVPGDPGQKVLRALDPKTGRTVWERPQQGPANSWGGVLSTEGGVLFACEDSGNFTALDVRDGALLWKFPANVLWKASPMTYSIDGRQHVAIAAGGTILAFALP
jgi:alcohol dehydrogenase (cytochrome c)